jgi:uncharacterized protein (TIGR04141 family)
MSEKLQIAIYKMEVDISLEEAQEIAKSKGFTEQSLDTPSVSGFKLNLYYQSKPSFPKWKEFVQAITKTDEPIAQGGKSRTEGFVLFLSKTDRLYAITGGHGHFVIQDRIDRNFGIDVFSRLIKKEDKILKSTREKSIVGGIMGTTKYFRNNFNLFDNDSFGKIYQELKAHLNKDILTAKLGFTEDDIKKASLCVAKSSFRVNKDISFDQLVMLIKGCESILETEQPVSINDIERLTKKRNQSLIVRLNKELVAQLWQRYSEPNNGVDFDLCHYEVEKYLTASHYVISKGNQGNAFGEWEFDDLSNADTVFELFRSLPKKPASQEVFEKLARNLIISSYDEEGVLLTQGGLIDHLLGDVPYDGKRYFFIDAAWYLIRDTFIERLNEHCDSYIQSHYMDGLDRPWADTLPTENDYNSQYIGSNNTLVLDKIIPENIEPCDILRWDDHTLYLYHVKAGFINTLRDLCAQIFIAATRIQQDVRTEKAFIRKAYRSLKDKIGGEGYFDKVGRQTEQLSEEAFVDLFNKKIVYVLAVLDTASVQRDIKDMKSFNSNIAKFSLQELSKQMRMQDLDFSITQIRRPS